MESHGRAWIARHHGVRDVAQKEHQMIRRWTHHPLLWSPLLAIIAQLMMAAGAAAVTGGGDFPRR